MVSQDWADGRSFVYDYDARGRLAGVSLNGTQLVANIYDYQERRVSRTQTSGGVSSTVHSIYDDSGQLLAEHDGATGAMLREYVWLESSLLAIVEGPVSAPVYSYVHTGHLDEPVMVTDASGQVTSSITRDPWGNAILLAGSAELSLGYPGQWHDQEAGLYQNWHRDYDPTLGRYIQTDPIGLAGGTNLYAYVDGNPVNAVDPTGEFGVPGAAGGAVFNLALQVGIGWYETGSFKTAVRCVDWGDVAISAAVGFAGPTLFGNVLGGNAGPFNLSRSQNVIGYGVFAMTGGQAKRILPPVRIGDDCECKTGRISEFISQYWAF